MFHSGLNMFLCPNQTPKLNSFGLVVTDVTTELLISRKKGRKII